MWYIAFTLGLFGSLHCVGMCGPLAIAFSGGRSNATSSPLVNGLFYNVGRTLTYSLIGVVFGLLGNLLFITQIQKSLSIVIGVLLIITFLFSINIDHVINNSAVGKTLYGSLQQWITKIMSKADNYHPLTLGMVNGLLPCGLVYLALAGALSTGTPVEGFFFMALFGLGTIPMLLGLSVGYNWMPINFRQKLRNVLPYVSLVFGAFMIYRGIVVDAPEEFNFWAALKNPIMCH